MGEVRRPLRGFLVHHERIDLDHLSANTAAATTSSYTEAAPRPGVAVPSDTRGTYTVRAHHAQDADVTVGVVRPGVVGNAGVIYKESAEADTEYRGWNEPNCFQGCWPIDWTTTSSWQPRSGSSMVAIPSSQQVVAIAADLLAAEAPSTWTWDPKTRSWGSRVTLDGSNLNVNRTALVVLSRIERVIAFYTEIASGVLYAKFSDDAGATWTQYGRDEGAGVTLNSAIDNLAVCEDRNGDLVMIGMENSSGDWWQYRSTDSGCTFSAVANGSGLGSRPRLVRMADGRVLVLYRDDATGEAHAIVLDDAYDTLTGKTGSQIDGSNVIGSLAVAVDADGVVVAYLAQASDDAVRVVYSVDNATTWTSYTQNAISAAYASATPEDYRVTLFAACFSAGECLVTCQLVNDASSPASAGSLVGLVFGGWSTAEMRGAGVTRRTRRSYGGNANESVFLPSDGLDTQGWTLTGTTHAVVAGRFRFAASGSACHTRVTSTTALSGGSHVVFDAAVLSLSGASDTGIAISERATAKVEIRANTSSFYAVDVEAGTQFGSTVNVAMNSGADPIVFAIVWATDDIVTVLYRRRSSSVWIKGPQKNGVVGGIGVQQRLQLGVMDAVTAIVSFGFVAIAESSLLVGPADQAPYLEDFQWGKPIGPAPYPVRDQGGDDVLYLSAAGGASRWNEQFSIAVRADHGLRQILPQESPGPDSRWRTTGTTEQVAAWDLTGAAVDTRLGTSWALGLALVGTNFAQAVLETRTSGGGSWDPQGTWDATLLAGASFVRAGELVRPATSGISAARFWPAGMLSGGTVIFDPSGTPVARRIRWNSGGGWGPGNALPPVLWLDGVTGSEPSSGTCNIIAPGGVLVVHQSTPAAYRRVRLRIPASQVTAEGYYELGQMQLGSLLIPGRQWSRGFSIRETPNVRFEEDDAGVIWPDRRGEVRRELTVAWQDGYDVSPLRRGPVVPYLAAAGVGLAAADDVRWQLSALLRESRGGEIPVTALLDIPRTTGMILDPSMWFPGVLTAVVQTNNVQGSEGQSEVDRIESVTVREQPWTRYAS